MSLQIKKIAGLGILIIITILVSSSVFSAAGVSKTQKMKAQIKTQQDTIDLLKLKLTQCSGGSNSYSYSGGSGKTMIPQDAITYP